MFQFSLDIFSTGKEGPYTPLRAYTRCRAFNQTVLWRVAIVLHV